MGRVGEGSHRCAGLLLVLTPPPLSRLAPPPFPPLPSPAPSVQVRPSVLQDDLHKAGHVGFFGLVGGEEGM